VMALLHEKPTSRRGVVQVFEAGDIAQHFLETPCTCSLQFAIRDNRLHMMTTMRSNDAYIGLPHDVFAFTMLQEILARTLEVRLGSYRHAVGSLHLYDSDKEAARTFLREGWQERVSMPAMPKTNPWPAIETLKRVEQEIRSGKDVDVAGLGLDDYWNDLIRLLQVYSLSRTGRQSDISAVRRAMVSHVYDPYIQKRATSQPKQSPTD
jgi:thymidylate synthase